MVKIKTIAGAAGALVAGTVAAQAGGFERGGNSVSVLFEKGRYVEFSLGSVQPDVSGTFPGLGATGDVAEDYLTFGVAYKADLNQQASIAVIIDQPWGAHVQYPVRPFGGGFANLRSSAITVAGRYKIDGNISLHGGLRYVTIDGELSVPTSGVEPQSFSSDADVGFLVGAAYELPEIALRVALTYFSETEHSLPSSRGTVGTINPPQSVNLDFQTGIAADTLLFGQIRWADWTSTRVSVPPAAAPNPPVLDHDNDAITYSIGLGRKFSEQWSGAVTVGYEKAQGGIASPLAPTDGYVSLGLGGTYTQDNMKITAGVRYVKLGDATTDGPRGASTFTGNSAVGFGIKVGYSF